MKRVGTLPIWRVVAAFLAAPAAAAIAYVAVLYAFWGTDIDDEIGPVGIGLIVLVGSYPLTLVLAVPTYLILRRWFWPGAFNCGLVGAAIGALTWTGYELRSLAAPVEGWLMFGQMLAEVAFAGAVGGLVFWSIAAAGIKRSKLDVDGVF